MLIRFLQDYQGHLTQNIHFHTKGQIVELDDATARALIGEGRAEPVVVVNANVMVAAQVEEPAPAPAPEPVRKGRGK